MGSQVPSGSYLTPKTPGLISEDKRVHIAQLYSNTAVYPEAFILLKHPSSFSFSLPEQGLKDSKTKEFFQDNTKRPIEEQEAQPPAPKSQATVSSSPLHSLSVASISQLSERSAR